MTQGTASRVFFLGQGRSGDRAEGPAAVFQDDQEHQDAYPGGGTVPRLPPRPTERWECSKTAAGVVRLLSSRPTLAPLNPPTWVVRLAHSSTVPPSSPREVDCRIWAIASSLGIARRPPSRPSGPSSFTPAAIMPKSPRYSPGVGGIGRQPARPAPLEEVEPVTPGDGTSCASFSLIRPSSYPSTTPCGRGVATKDGGGGRGRPGPPPPTAPGSEELVGRSAASVLLRLPREGVRPFPLPQGWQRETGGPRPSILHDPLARSCPFSSPVFEPLIVVLSVRELLIVVFGPRPPDVPGTPPAEVVEPAEQLGARGGAKAANVCAPGPARGPDQARQVSAVPIKPGVGLDFARGHDRSSVKGSMRCWDRRP
ncbi:hypothetical protein THAOC_07542, partial [Thalassiosira oceanica]